MGTKYRKLSGAIGSYGELAGDMMERLDVKIGENR
jgi:hypothetical protein